MRMSPQVYIFEYLVPQAHIGPSWWNGLGRLGEGVCVILLREQILRFQKTYGIFSSSALVVVA